MSKKLTVEVSSPPHQVAIVRTAINPALFYTLSTLIRPFFNVEPEEAEVSVADLEKLVEFCTVIIQQVKEFQSSAPKTDPHYHIYLYSNQQREKNLRAVIELG